MTVLVGVLCHDGVVVGSDSSVTFGVGETHTIEQHCLKTFVIEPDVVFACTGAMGLGQRFEMVLRSVRSSPGWGRPHPLTSARKICRRMIADLKSTFHGPGDVGALVAFHHATGGPQLCEFEVPNFQPELKNRTTWFASMGSGQPITDPFLAHIRRVLLPDRQPNLREGVFLTAWALDHAIKLNTGGINGPPQIATLRPTGGGAEVRVLDPADLDEHFANIRGVEALIRDYFNGLSGLGPPPGSADPQPVPPGR